MKKYVNGFCKNKFTKKLVSICLAFAMILTMLPSSMFMTEADAAEGITIHYQNTNNWSTVYGYSWNLDNDGADRYSGDWPGSVISKNANNGDNNWYDLVLTGVETSNLGVIFNNGDGNQTGDIKIYDVSAGDEYWYNGSLLTTAPDGWVAKEDARDITIHYNNTNGWSTVYGYAWYNDGSNDVYLNGTWPGSTVTKDMEHTGSWYTLTLSDVESSSIGVIFNNGEGSQTGDITISDIPAENAEYWYDNGSLSTTAPEDWNVAVETRDVTIYYKNSNSWSTVSAYVWYNNGSKDVYLNGIWPGNATTRNTEHSGWYTLTLTDVPSDSIGVIFSNNGSSKTDDIMISDIPMGEVEYWYNGELLTSAPFGWDDDSEGNCTVKLHFANTLAWDAVCAYAWRSTGSEEVAATDNWPGNILTRDADGYYTLELNYNLTDGETLGYIFSNCNGSQTADLSIDNAALSTGNVELWIQPDTLDSNGKYTCSVSSVESSLCMSPEVNGTNVTFRYKGSVSDSVYVCGSMNSWATNSSYKMTQDSDGVWSVTVSLDPGTYQYKLVVDGTWLADPMNSKTVGSDGNSVVLVKDTDTSTDTDYITVKLHFCHNNATDYSSWDAWMWTDSLEGKGYTFEKLSDTEMVATIKVPGKSTNSVGYIIRKSDWSDKEFTYDRYIDLSKVYSGTVHYCVFSGVSDGVLILGEDVVAGGKVTSAEYDFTSGKIYAYSSLPISDYSQISVYDSTGSSVAVSDVWADGCTYAIVLTNSVSVNDALKYKVQYAGNSYSVGFKNVAYSTYYSDEFKNAFTYTGDDLGATWSESSTTFKVWAPTAEAVQVALYYSGTYTNNDMYAKVDMTRGDKGVWSVTINGDLNGKYYTYLVTDEGYTKEACDPYARTTGAYGDRAMVIDLDSTDPEGWDEDVSPNQGMSYTDAVIYELHVREFSIDDSSGISDEYQGKFLALTETGTTTSGGNATGLDYLKSLGITHLQLMPIYDYASADETYNSSYGWGYDPKNYNVPEGAYATDAYNGEVRVKELKETVQTLHENGINVVMDVVYNHVGDSGSFCFNKLVPGYFSRISDTGVYSNGSGCGNDTASERSMVRKYIVDSVMYWAEEYHIDGFRFDLAGLLDVETINEIIVTVHEKYPYVMFYGEGWAAGDTDSLATLATKANSSQTPGFGYFNDFFREAVVNTSSDGGYAMGQGYMTDSIANCLTANAGWCNSPTQLINYVSCHDGYTLIDKIIVKKSGTSWSDMIRMGNLAAAIGLLSQGVPFIQAGDDFLREKTDEWGRYDNSYNKSDYVNSLKWSNLDADNGQKAAVAEYYKGLIEFRKNHEALRMTSSSDIYNNTEVVNLSGSGEDIIIYKINGQSDIANYSSSATYPDEVADAIVIILNPEDYDRTLTLSDYYLYGDWEICVTGDQAGTTSLGTVKDGGSVTVERYSALVLVKGALVDTDSVYTQNAPAAELFSISYTNMTLGNDLAMNFAFEADSVEDWTGYSVEVTKTYADGSEDAVETYSYDDGEWTATTINSEAYYYVTFDNIAAKEMTDNVYVTIYDANGKKVSNTYEDSVRGYAMRALDNSANSDECKTMIVDMLNYGADAQSYFSYNEDDLANSKLTTAQKAYATASVTCENKREKDSDTYYCGTSLILESNIKMQIAFKNLTTDMYAVVTYSDHDGNQKRITVSGSDFTVEDGYYIINLNTIVVADGRQSITITIYDSNDKVVTTVKDSMESYLARTSESYDDKLFTSLMKFSDSAYAYFH